MTRLKSQIAVLILLFTAIATVHAAGVSDPGGQSVGLVLSGGGSKGIAHIGVIKALEDNDIPIDYITGTSMGAIVGGLYACGYTPEEMMALLLSRDFSFWSTGKIDPDYVYYFTAEEPRPVMLSVPIPSKRDSIAEARAAVPASLINPMPMSFAFMELFSAYTAQCGGDFDRLFVPFRCVASDAAAKRKVVLSRGDVGDAIRASMSFPIVFQPTMVDSVLLYDGGIYDNFPVDVMRRTFAPSIMIGVDVSTPTRGPQTSLMAQIEELVIQDSDYSMPSDEGIKMHIDLHEFGLLDFPKAQQIYQIGYDRAMEMMDSIKMRVHSRVPAAARDLRRSVFKSATPYVRFDSVAVKGGTPRQNQYLDYIFTGMRADTFGIAHARRSYYRAITPGKLRDLTPHAVYDDTTGMFTLRLKAAVKDNFKAGFGGYVTSSTSSYVYLSAGYSTLSFSSIAADLGGWIGQSYMGAALNARLFLRTRCPSSLGLQAVVSRQKYYQSDYLFYEDKTPSFILNHEYFTRLKWEFAAGGLGRLDFGVGYGHLYDNFFPGSVEIDYNAERDKIRHDLGQLYLRYMSNTLDDINFPTQGRSYTATVMGVTGRSRLDPGRDAAGVMRGARAVTHPAWIQMEAVTRNYWPMGRHFTLGVETDIMLSTRKLLGDYDASVVSAPVFAPTPSSNNAFGTSFRANSFLAAGIVPVYRYNQSVSARIQGYCFMPLRRIERDAATGMAMHSRRWLSHPEFFGEFDVSYKLPFATVTGYCNYSTGVESGWNVGISFGVYLLAPKFLR